MKLYEVPRNTWVRSIDPRLELTFKLKTIDGMYSYCMDTNGDPLHLSANLDVELLYDKNNLAQPDIPSG